MGALDLSFYDLRNDGNFHTIFWTILSCSSSYDIFSWISQLPARGSTLLTLNFAWEIASEICVNIVVCMSQMKNVLQIDTFFADLRTGYRYSQLTFALAVGALSALIVLTNSPNMLFCVDELSPCSCDMGRYPEYNILCSNINGTADKMNGGGTLFANAHSDELYAFAGCSISFAVVAFAFFCSVNNTGAKYHGTWPMGACFKDPSSPTDTTFDTR